MSLPLPTEEVRAIVSQEMIMVHFECSGRSLSLLPLSVSLALSLLFFFLILLQLSVAGGLSMPNPLQYRTTEALPLEKFFVVRT